MELNRFSGNNYRFLNFLNRLSSSKSTDKKPYYFIYKDRWWHNFRYPKLWICPQNEPIACLCVKILYYWGLLSKQAREFVIYATNYTFEIQCYIIK